MLSLVIPAYNEEERLPVMLDAALACFKLHRSKIISKCQNHTSSKATKLQWIVVSDGSTDKTADVVRKYGSNSNSSDTWILLTLQRNSGKGCAVKTGMLAATGKLRLMVDADGATDFGTGLELLLEATSVPVVFGSRAHLVSKAQRSMLRTTLMHAFHFFVELLCSSNVRDTQCGFKLFTAEAAQSLFQTLHLQRWAFDIELVILAERLGLAIEEVGVPWHEVDGSKLDTNKIQLAIVSLGMLRDMICVRLCYEMGIWKTKR